MLCKPGCLNNRARGGYSLPHRPVAANPATSLFKPHRTAVSAAHKPSGDTPLVVTASQRAKDQRGNKNSGRRLFGSAAPNGFGR
jgi:hypothetical protein